MKKKKNVILLSILLVAIGIGIYYYQVKFVKLPIEKVAPAQPLFYLHIYDVGERIKEIKSTKLWQNIKKIDIEELLKRSKFSQKQIEQYRKFKINLSNFLSTLFLDKFFGEEIAFAVYSFPTKKTDSENKSFLSLAVITRVKPGAEFLEFIYKLGKGNLKVSYEKYKGRKITLVKFPHRFNFAYTKIRDLIIISPDKKILYSFWDAFLKEKTALSFDENFLFLRKELFASSYLLGYWDMDKLASVIKEKITAIFPNELKSDVMSNIDANEILKSWKGIEKGGFALTGENNLCKGRVVYFFNKNLLPPYYADIYTTKPEKNYTLRFIPQKVISYGWINWFDLKSLGKYFLQELRKAQEKEGVSFKKIILPQEIEEIIESISGVRVEDINKVIGKEAGGYLYDIDTENIFPIFKFLFFIEVKKKDIVEEIINNWAKRAGFTFSSNNYEGFKIRYFHFSPLDLKICWCFVDRFILISLSSGLIEKSIDVYKKKATSLEDNSLFRKIKFQLSDENNMVGFLNTKVFLQKIKELCDWWVNWVSFLRLGIKTQKIALLSQIEQIKKDMEEINLKIRELNKRYQSLRKEIEKLKTQEESISLKEEELKKLDEERKKEEERKRKMLEELREKEKILKEIELSFWDKLDLSLVKFYLTEVIYPLIDGLKEIKAEFSGTVFKEKIIVRNVYFLY